MLGEKSKKDCQFQIYKNIKTIISGNYQLSYKSISENSDNPEKIFILVFDHATNFSKDWYNYSINPIFNHYT